MEVVVSGRSNVGGSGLDEHGSGSGGGVVYHGVEAAVVVGGVLHSPDGAVGFVEGVRALHDITVAGLLLGLVVTGVAVSYGVVVLVFGVSVELFSAGYDGGGVVGNRGGSSVVGHSGGGVVGDGRGGVVGHSGGSDGYALGWLVMTHDVLGRDGSS